MLTKEQNERLTQVGKGTPGGEFLRRYWHPVAVAAELTPEKPKRRIRLLGEDLVLYRDENGHYGLVGEQCSHRGCSLYYGFVEDGGIRCPYHGWMYDRQGKILEMPFEPAESMLKHTLRHPAYLAMKVRGLIFAYMGPLPAPILPPWDVIVRDDGTHNIEVHAPLNCNWVQMFETNVDPTHNTFLHNKTAYVLGLRDHWEFRPIELEFERIEWGLIKRREFGGDGGYKEEGHPILMPNILRHSSGRGPIDLQWRTPIDDTHTQTFVLEFCPSADGSIVESSEDPPWSYDALKDEAGYFTMRTFPSQDSMAWETQGPIRDRSIERLGHGDRGVVMLRELLAEQVDRVARGEDPMGVIREPGQYEIIAFSQSK